MRPRAATALSSDTYVSIVTLFYFNLSSFVYDLGKCSDSMEVHSDISSGVGNYVWQPVLRLGTIHHSHLLANVPS